MQSRTKVHRAESSQKAHSCRISWSTGGSLVVAPAGQHRSMRLLLLVESLVVVLLYSACHASHVIMAVEWKNGWKTHDMRKKSSQKESSFLLLPAGRWSVST